jgi:hypothetical protein
MSSLQAAMVVRRIDILGKCIELGHGFFADTHGLVMGRFTMSGDQGSQSAQQKKLNKQRWRNKPVQRSRRPMKME